MTATLYVCTTCKRGEPVPEGTAPPGAELHAALMAHGTPAGVRIVGVECLSACNTGCAVSLSKPGAWSYVYGRLGSENAAQPGFNAAVYQVDRAPDSDPVPVQPNIPNSIALDEAVLAGLLGPNTADLSGAIAGKTYAVPGTINWVDSTGSTANFPNDEPFPGIPGMSGSEDDFVHEIITYIRFPSAGYYKMGINNEDSFRLTAATAGVQTLRLIAPAIVSGNTEVTR